MAARRAILHPAGLIVVAGLAVGAPDGGDWRVELLEEEGHASGIDSLRKLRRNLTLSEERVLEAVKNLGSGEFVRREEAEREILLMGSGVLRILRSLPPSDDPEVRVRLREIQRVISAERRWSRVALLRHAVGSILEEREEHGDPLPFVFAELFRKPAPSLDGGYRRFRFEAHAGLGGLVSDGVLRMRGNHATDGDQRLVLTSSALTGEEELPDRFFMEVELGGEAGGEGNYHLGVSVGKVRALFHPGHAGGGFRFEQVGTRHSITSNVSMGFDPAAGALQRMSLEASRSGKGNVALLVKITSADGAKEFSDRQVIEAGLIGKLDSISLDRSGRNGGDALFDGLVVELGAR